MAQRLVGFERNLPDDGPGAAPFAQDECDDQRPSGDAEFNAAAAGHGDGDHAHEHADDDAQRERGEVQLRHHALGIAKEARDLADELTRHDHAQAVAQFQSDIGQRQHIDVGAAQAGDLRVETAIEFQFSNALAHQRLVGDKHAAHFDVLAAEFQALVRLSAKILRGLFDVGLLADGDDNVVFLEKRVFGGYEEIALMTHARDDDAGGLLDAQFANGAIEKRGIGHHEVLDYNALGAGGHRGDLLLLGLEFAPLQRDKKLVNDQDGKHADGIGERIAHGRIAHLLGHAPAQKFGDGGQGWCVG